MSLIENRIIDSLIYERRVFFFSSRRRHTRFDCDWSSDVCSCDLLCKTSPFCANSPRIPPVTLITARLHLPFASSDLPMLLVSSESAGLLPFSGIPPAPQAISSHLIRVTASIQFTFGDVMAREGMLRGVVLLPLSPTRPAAPSTLFVPSSPS